MNSPPPRTWTEEEFNAIARHAAAQSQGGEAQNISMLDQWAIENADLLSKVQIVGFTFTPKEQETLSRWFSQDSELLRSLIPEPETLSPESKPSLIKWLMIGGGSLIVVIAAIALFAGFTTASNPKPSKTVASKNVEIDSSYIPSDESLEKVVRTPTANPNPAPQTVGNATVVIPEEFDCLTVRNSDGLGIGFVYDGDRVTVIRSIRGSDRVTIKTPTLTGSVVRDGINRDGKRTELNH